LHSGDDGPYDGRGKAPWEIELEAGRVLKQDAIAEATVRDNATSAVSIECHNGMKAVGLNCRLESGTRLYVPCVQLRTATCSHDM